MPILFVVLAYTLASLAAVRAEADIYHALGIRPLHIHIGSVGPKRMFRVRGVAYPVVVSLLPIGAQLCHSHDGRAITMPVDQRMWMVGIRSVAAFCMGLVSFSVACAFHAIAHFQNALPDLVSAAFALLVAWVVWVMRREACVRFLVPLGFILPLALATLLLWPLPAPTGGFTGALANIAAYWTGGCLLLVMYDTMPFIFFNGARLLDLYMFYRAGNRGLHIAGYVRGLYTAATVTVLACVLSAIGV